MEFGVEKFFWAYLFVPLFVGLFIWLSLSRERALKRFAQGHLIKRLLPAQLFDFRPLKWTIFLLSYSLLVFALTRPQFGLKLVEEDKEGVDIMVALDISKSMLAEDIAPNRIKRAKHEIGKLFDMLEGDRIGLIVFAGASYVQLPLTEDYKAAKKLLDVVNTGWMSAQGTDLAGAIRMGDTCLTMEGADKVLIIISDGEEQQGDADAAARAAANNGVTIYTVGVGSEDGEPIPIRENGELTYKRKANGEMVHTKLNTMLLEKIAIAGNGRYFSAGLDLNLREIYKEIQKMEKGAFGKSEEPQLHDQYQLFLMAAIILFFISFLLPERVLGKREWRGRFE